MSKQQSLKTIIREEYKKCAVNPIHFIKKYCMINHPIRGKIPFILYPFQERVLEQFRKNGRNIILKNRQMGISTLIAAYALWFMLFNPGKFVYVIATKQDVAKNLISKVRLMHKNLPSWLKVKCIEDNKLGQSYENGSVIVAGTSTGDSGRSEAASLLIVDECAHIDNMNEIWGALQPTISTGGDIVVLSTPNGMGNWFHKTYTQAENKQNTFNAIMLHWTMHPERDQKWRDEQDTELGPRFASQECDGSFISSGNTVVDGEKLEWYRINQVMEPIEITGIDRNIWMWEYPAPGKSYMIVSDVARGDGSDFSTFHVIDLEDVRQVAEYEGKIGTTEFGNLLVEFGTKFNDALIVVENNGPGWAVLQTIINRNYANLYYTDEETKQKIVEENVFRNKINKMEKRRVPGFITSEPTRILFVTKMEEFFRKDLVTIRSSRLITQLQTFIWKGGRAEHANGYNDDLVMALAIGVWVRDVALRIKSKSIEITKYTLDNFKVDNQAPVFDSSQNYQNPYNMTIKSGETEDLRSWI